jgi:hypothetical protein
MKRLLIGAILAVICAPLCQPLFAAPPAPQAAGRDPSCVQACQARRDRESTEAAKLRDTGGYYMGLASSNCWSPPDLPAGQPDPCASALQQCEGACASGSNYAACAKQCRQTYQGCCYGSALKIAERHFGLCVAECPASEAAADLTAGAWQSSTAEQLGADLLALKPLDQAVADNRGRGGFIVAEDPAGGFVFIDDQGYRRSLTGVAASGSFLLLNEVDLIDFGLSTLGIASSEHSSIRGTINGGGDFVQLLRERRDRQYLRVASLEVLQSIAGSTLLLASSEHGSIRGTINGGGEFIKVPPDPPVSIGDAAGGGPRARLILAGTAASAMRQLPRASPVWNLRLPGATVTVPPSTALGAEIGRNGMIGLAVAQGAVVATDRRTNQKVSVPAGGAALFVPGIGMSDLSTLPTGDSPAAQMARQNALQKQARADAAKSQLAKLFHQMMKNLMTNWPRR